MNPDKSWIYDILNSDNIQEEMRNFKFKSTPEQICEGDRCQSLIPLCKEAYATTYEERPQYGKMIFMLEMELFKMFCIPDNVYSFMQNNSRFVGRALEYHGMQQSALTDPQVIDEVSDFGDVPETNNADENIKTKLKDRLSKPVDNKSVLMKAKAADKQKVRADILKSIARLEEMSKNGVVNINQQKRPGTIVENKI